MPTFSTIALENLLEPNVTRPTKSKDSIPIPQVRRQPLKDAKRIEKKPQHVYFSPSLYTTPEPTPIADSPSSFSPSPYVLNYKRREPRPQRTENGPTIVVERVVECARQNSVSGEVKSLMEDGCVISQRDGIIGEVSLTNVEIGDVELDMGDFSDTQNGNGLDVNEGAEDECERSSVACPSEFYDATEDFSRDGSPSQTPCFLRPGLQAELDALKLDLLLEIEKRKKAEDAIQHMHAQWDRIAKQLSQVGLSFPMFDKSGKLLEGGNVAEVLSQEVAVARLVSAAVGSGNARAEAEAVAESLINTKNVEIARLRDKLQYYEAVNHEMTQRNLENFEASRRLRRRRQMRKKWFWSSIGLSLAFGACYLTYYSHLSPLGTKLADISSFSTTDTSKPESGTDS